ncbi:MAG TPA: NADH-quinone oxidoreductase subunit J [Cytophagaceae bacterium]
MDQILFLILSGLAICGALAVIFSKSPVYSVLALVLTFFSIAGHYALLNANFLFIVHIIVYAGAILVLFLFVIMLLNLNKEAEAKQPILIKLAAFISGGLFLFTLFGALKGMDLIITEKAPSTNIGSVEVLGQVLFNDFILPFEISSVLFLSAMIGAVMLGKKDLKEN